MMEKSLTLSRIAGFAASYSVIIAFLAVIVFFSLSSPTFLTLANLYNILVNNIVMLAIVALGMTLVVSSGGIDLSVGVAVDMASMIFVMLLAAGFAGFTGVAIGLAAAIAVGVLNSILVTRLRISPFLATLGVLFIGQSTQQLSTGGGLPIYMTSGYPAEQFNLIARTSIAGFPTPVIILILCIVVIYVALHRSVFGRYVLALGVQPGVAWYSGIRIARHISWVYVRLPRRHHRNPPVGHRQVLCSAIGQCLPAGRDRRNLHRHDLEPGTPALRHRNLARGRAARGGEERPASHWLEFLLAAGRRRRAGLPGAGRELRPAPPSQLILSGDDDDFRCEFDRLLCARHSRPAGKPHSTWRSR
jgi:hypothetical protein